MKTKYLTSLFICLIFTFGSFFAQSPSTITALGVFINTPFFDEFQQSREQAEETVRQFKSIQHQYDPDEVEIIRDLYNGSAEMFNKALRNIKNDMLHREKRNYLVNHPDSYSKQVETDIQKARAYYEENFQARMAALTEGEITSASFLTLIPQLIEVCNTAFQMLNTIRAEIRRFNSELLEASLVEPYRFRTWDEIQ